MKRLGGISSHHGVSMACRPKHMAQKEQRQNAVAKESILRRSEKRFLERTKSKRGFKSKIQE